MFSLRDDQRVGEGEHRSEAMSACCQDEKKGRSESEVLGSASLGKVSDGRKRMMQPDEVVSPRRRRRSGGVSNGRRVSRFSQDARIQSQAMCNPEQRRREGVESRVG